MSPEEQFAHFFSQMGGMQFHHRTRRGGTARHQQQRGDDAGRNPMQWLQMLFMFLAIFVFPSFVRQRGYVVPAFPPPLALPRLHQCL